MSNPIGRTNHGKSKYFVIYKDNIAPGLELVYSAMGNGWGLKKKGLYEWMAVWYNRPATQQPSDGDLLRSVTLYRLTGSARKMWYSDWNYVVDLTTGEIERGI